MNLDKDTHVEALIDAHFALRTSAYEETTFRAHMSRCDRCRGHYERCLTIENLSPGKHGQKQRLRSALGLPMPRAPKARWAWATSAFGAAAAVGVAVWVGTQLTLQPALRDQPNGFAERGTNDSAGALSVFAVVAGDKLQPLAPNAAIATNAELSLSYRVAEQATFAMVFAVDSANQIHWYVPAWKDPNDAPTAKPVQGGQSYELAAGVAHRLAEGNLRIVAVFCKRAANVRQIEAAWAQGDVNFTRFDPAAKVVIHKLAVKAPQ